MYIIYVSNPSKLRRCSSRRFGSPFKSFVLGGINLTNFNECNISNFEAIVPPEKSDVKVFETPRCGKILETKA